MLFRLRLSLARRLVPRTTTTTTTTTITITPTTTYSTATHHQQHHQQHQQQHSHPDTPDTTSAHTQSLQAQLTHLLPLYPQPPPVFTHGEKCRLFDSDGRAYLDLNSGIAVNALGHADPEIVAAIHDQAGKLIHLSNLYRNEYAGPLATALINGLCQRVPDNKNNQEEVAGIASLRDDKEAMAHWGKDARVFFCNSGTEANEGAIKFARKHAKLHRGDHNANTILSFTNAFHGRTMGALSATPSVKYQAPFTPLVPGFIHSPFNDIEALEKIDWTSIAGVIVEPVQGEGGVFPATDAFLQAVSNHCKKVGALLIFDEIQCGLGRTGKLFAHQWTPVRPDILTLAKPLANGLPIGAVISTSKVAASIVPGDHGTTFGGNPLSTRIGTIVLSRLTPHFLSNVTQTSTRLVSSLNALSKAHPRIFAGPVRGRGLLLGLPMVESIPTSVFVDACRKRGVLVISAGLNTVRIVPPLIIGEKDVDVALRVFEEVADEIESGLVLQK